MNYICACVLDELIQGMENKKGSRIKGSLGEVILLSKMVINASLY